MSNCKTLGNTAGNLCPFDAQVPRRWIFVPENDSSGTKNELANVAAVTKTALQAKCVESNLKDRFYPLPPMKNAEEVRAESEYYEYEDGSQEFIKEGTYSFKGFIPKIEAGPDLLGRLKMWKGQDFGGYKIDTIGNFGYNKGSAGEVQPFLIDGDTFDAVWVYGKYKEPLGIEVRFNLRSEVVDEDMGLINKSSLDFDGRTSDGDLFALRDVTIEESSNTLTTLVVAITTDNDVPVPGLSSTDMYLYNTTATAEITINTVTEVGVTGVYTLTFAAVTEADAYSLNLESGSKYDPADTLTGTLTA